MRHALVHWRSLGPAVRLGWLGIGATTGACLTVNPPFGRRVFTLLLPAALLGAAVANGFSRLSLPGIRRLAALGRFIFAALNLILAAAPRFASWRTYVEDKGTVATARTRIARYFANQPPVAQAYLVSRNFQPRDGELESLAAGRLVANLSRLSLGRTMARVNGPTLLMPGRDNASLLAVLEQRYPTGRATTHFGNAPEAIAFHVFRLRRTGFSCSTPTCQRITFASRPGKPPCGIPPILEGNT